MRITGFTFASCLSFFLVVVVSLSSPVHAVESGPAVGEKVSPFKLLVLADDDNTYSEQDVVAKRKDKLSVYAFVQAAEWSRPMARYLRDLDKVLDGLGGEARMAAIWLTDDQKKSKQYLPRGRGALKLKATTFAVYAGDKSGPNGWGINSDAFLTVVVTRNGKVVKSFAYLSVNTTDIPDVRKTLRSSKK